MYNLSYGSKHTVCTIYQSAVGKFCATMEKLEKLYTKRPLVYTCPQATPPNSHLFCGFANGFFFSIFSIDLHIRPHSHTCLIFCPFINLQFFYADIKTCLATFILLLYIPAGIVGSYMYAGALLSCTQGEKRELDIPPSTLL